MIEAQGGGNSGFEVAATYYNVTGKRTLLDQAIRSADALYEDFRVNNPPFSGGERDAINCVQLYRATHEKKHLDLAKYYLDIRGLESSVNRSRHNQSYKPVLEQSEAVGHAVNCASLMVSLTDVGVLTGIKDYVDAAQRMWLDAVDRKMYITGGVGTTGNEGFGEPYSLPNISAYSETCAVLMFITLNHRMFMATGDGKYIDVLERGMYNNAIDGVSASGTGSSTSTGWPVPATDVTLAGNGRRSSAALRISFGSWPRCRASFTLRMGKITRKTRSTSTCTSPVRRRSRSTRRTLR
jgi:DUF1680 family protein